MATYSPKVVPDNQRNLKRSEIVHYILREHRGICFFEDVIGKETIPFKNKKEIEEYIKSEEGKGTLGMQHAPQGDLVFVNFGEGAELCNTYKKKKSSFCQKTCQNFHLCDFGLRGKCRYKVKCKFYHNLQNEHNRNLVTKLNLDDIADEDILSYLKLKQSIQRKINRNSNAKIRNGSEHLTTRNMPDKTILVDTNPSQSVLYNERNESGNSIEDKNSVLEQQLTTKEFENENDKTFQKVTKRDSSFVTSSHNTAQVEEQKDNMTKERSGSYHYDKHQKNISKQEKNDAESVCGDQMDLLHTGSSESTITSEQNTLTFEEKDLMFDAQKRLMAGIQEKDFGTHGGIVSREVEKDICGPNKKYFNLRHAHICMHTLKDTNWEQSNQNTKNELTLRNSKIPTTPICNKYITNSCKDPHCDMYHYSMPYLWCIAENNEWKEFDLKANVEIEKSYSDPNNESTIVRNSKIITKILTYCNGKDILIVNFSLDGLNMKTSLGQLGLKIWQGQYVPPLKQKGFSLPTWTSNLERTVCPSPPPIENFS